MSGCQATTLDNGHILLTFLDVEQSIQYGRNLPS